MPPEGSPCPNTPCQNAQEYGVPKTLTETVPPLISGDSQWLCAFVGLVFTLSAVHHSANCCVAENSDRENCDADYDGIVGHGKKNSSYFFLVSPKLRTPSLFILPKTLLRTEVIELSKDFIIPLVFISVNTVTKYQSLNSVS